MTTGPRGWRRALFVLIMLTPAALLSIALVVVARDVYRFRTADPAAIYQGLRTHLAQKQPTDFPLPAGMLVRDPDRKTVYIFGESSLVLSDGRTFPQYLEEDHADLRVVNFGVSGVDSFSVRHRAASALAAARPDVIVLYYGHNDYNSAYQNYVLPTFFQQGDAFLKLRYFFYDPAVPTGPFAEGAYYWFARQRRPILFQMLQHLRLVNPDSRAFEPVNQLVLDTFIRNNNALLDLAASLNVPVVMITPVGNLHAEPYGDVDSTTRLYQQGLAATDYEQSWTYLKQAQDSEIFTFDLRAKSPLVNHIRNLRRPNVFVVDLETRLKAMRFGFGHDEFLDYFHFNDRAHRVVATIIYESLAENRLVGSQSNRAGPR